MISHSVVSPNEKNWLCRLPSEVLQMITDHLKASDLVSLSQTCRSFYTFCNDDQLWFHRIRCQFPQTIAQLYTSGLYQKPEIIQTFNELRPSGFVHNQAGNELDLLAIHSATHYNDEAIERRQEKIYVSKEYFRNNVEFYQYDKPDHHLDIPLMKLIYFYLIDRKRYAAVDMNVVHHEFDDFITDNEVDSLTGLILRLENACRLEITGRFEYEIMPGKYEVSWRMKFDQLAVKIWGETEFIVVPQHGQLLDYRMSENDFHHLLSEHENRWFVRKMGQILIYEPSIVLVAIRNWNDTRAKSNLSWDCIELTLVP